MSNKDLHLLGGAIIVFTESKICVNSCIKLHLFYLYSNFHIRNAA